MQRIDRFLIGVPNVDEERFKALVSRASLSDLTYAIFPAKRSANLNAFDTIQNEALSRTAGATTTDMFCTETDRINPCYGQDPYSNVCAALKNLRADQYLCFYGSYALKYVADNFPSPMNPFTDLTGFGINLAERVYYMTPSYFRLNQLEVLVSQIDYSKYSKILSEVAKKWGNTAEYDQLLNQTVMSGKIWVVVLLFRINQYSNNQIMYAIDIAVLAEQTEIVQLLRTIL
jgi:hypothetical protein